jgi:hypothetical protein
MVALRPLLSSIHRLGRESVAESLASTGIATNARALAL